MNAAPHVTYWYLHNYLLFCYVSLDWMKDATRPEGCGCEVKKYSGTCLNWPPLRQKHMVHNSEPFVQQLHTHDFSDVASI